MYSLYTRVQITCLALAMALAAPWAMAQLPVSAGPGIQTSNPIQYVPYNYQLPQSFIQPGNGQTGDEMDFLNQSIPAGVSCSVNALGFLSPGCIGQGPGPYVDCASYGCVGDLYSSTNAYLTIATGTQLHLASSGAFLTNAAVGQYAWIIGGGFNQTSAPGISFVAGGTAASNQLCVQVALRVASGISANNLTIAKGPASTETCATPSGSQAIQITAPASQTLNGVTSSDYEIWIGPTRAERRQNPNINVTVTGVASASGSAVTFNISTNGNINPLSENSTVNVTNFSASCSQYNISGIPTAVTSTTFTLSSSATGGSCASGQSANAQQNACTLDGPDETGQYYCTIAGGNAFFGNYTVHTPIAPQNDGVNPGSTAYGWFRSLITSVNSNVLVTLQDPAPQTSGSSGSPVHATWFTDNSAYEASAVARCLAFAFATLNAAGCGVFFEPPGTPIPGRSTTSTGWYGSIKALTLPNTTGYAGGVNLFANAASPIQAANSYASGLSTTNNLPSVALATVGSDFAVKVGITTVTPSPILTHGFQMSNIGVMDATASSGNFGIGAGGIEITEVADVKILDVSAFGYSGGTPLQFDGTTTNSQSIEIRGFNCINSYYGIAAIWNATDIQIYGGECSGVGNAVATPTSRVPTGSIGLYCIHAATIRGYGMDFQNFGTASAYAFDCKQFSLIHGRYEEVGQSSLTNSSALVVDGDSTTLTANFDIESPQIAAGFAKSVTVTSAAGVGTIAGTYTLNALNILNNSGALGVQTQCFCIDTLNTPSQATVVQFNPAFSGAPTTNNFASWSSTTQIGDSGVAVPTGSLSTTLNIQNPTGDTLCDTSTTGCTGGQITCTGGPPSTACTETAFATTYTIPANLIGFDQTVRVTIGYQTVAGSTAQPVTVRLRATNASGTQLGGFAASTTLSTTKSGQFILYLGGTTAPAGTVNVNTSGWGAINNGLLYDATNSPVLVSTNAGIALVPTALFTTGGTANVIKITNFTVEYLP